MDHGRLLRGSQAPRAALALEPGAAYTAAYFNPDNGREHVLGPVTPDDQGNWPCPKPPVLRDWVLVLDGRGT